MNAHPVEVGDGVGSGVRDFRSAIQFCLIGCTTLPGKLVDVLIIVLNLTMCASLVVETYPVATL